MIKDILYVGSQSQSRHKLLELARIPFKVLPHGSDENVVRAGMPVSDYVLAIAKDKMNSLVLPNREDIEADYLFVVTADTLIRKPSTDELFSKPLNRNHAVEMLRAEREEPLEVATGCCVNKFEFRNNKWEVIEAIHWTTNSFVEFYVDAEYVDIYLSVLPIALRCSGAGVVEDHGLAYLKSISGSYTATIGLPLYELRQALKKLSFQF